MIQKLNGKIFNNINQKCTLQIKKKQSFKIKQKQLVLTMVEKKMSAWC